MGGLSLLFAVKNDLEGIIFYRLYISVIYPFSFGWKWKYFLQITLGCVCLLVTGILLYPPGEVKDFNLWGI